MAAARYGFLELWNDLENNFQKFNVENMTPASSLEDADAFELAHKAIKEMIADGRASQAIAIYWDPAEKANLGLKAKNAFLTNFGPEQVPPVKGIRSLAFLREVILPHIENAQKVQYDTIFTWLCGFVGIDVEAERLQAASLAKKYRDIIAKMESTEMTPDEIAGQSFRLFSSSAVDVALNINQEAAVAVIIVDEAALPRLAN